MPSQSVLRSIEEIPLAYQSVFKEYPCFNVVQSAVLDQAVKTDTSFVVSAPTGSGKTAIFEMAIIRDLIVSDESPITKNNKIIYISPIKALCQERLIDWHKKFSGFGVTCISVTSDSDDIDPKTLLQNKIIISTPEKWDVMTRRWKENNKLIDAVTLFLIDEVHLLNADTRGSTLEVIVSRMKTARGSYMFNRNNKDIRFIALSATIPNIEDIAEWIGQSEPAKYFHFSEDVRPVKLNKIVLGYNFNPQSQSVFKFDMSLSYKLSGLISKYSEGKPTLIFCNTRKSVEMTANHLVSNLQIRLSQEQKETLINISKAVGDVKLKQHIVHGIAFHHAGLVLETRHTIEESFKKGQIPVLATTSTLAMGVNLPAHLVIVKCTKCYSDGGYKDYDEVSIFQMIGRAGRSQFDTTATVLILTSLQDKIKYEQMLSCSQIIESNLHKHLTEHLNAEVVLRTITDLEVAMRWLSSTFLYVRARKSPEKYKLPAGLSKEKIDKKLLEMCQIDLNKLVGTGMIRMNQAIEVSPTVIGEIMAKFYVAFDTMKLFTQLTGSEILIQILLVISKCKEFSEFYLRTNDKRCLNLLNKNAKKECIRFPLTGRIKSVDMKINVIIQAVLGNMDIHNQSVLCDSMKIMRSCERLANCLIEYLETRDNCYNALSSAIILAKCFRVKLWENSPYVSKQLTGVGQVISTLLMKAGKTTFKEIATTNPRHIEMIVNRKAPFGNTIVDEASRLPQYFMSLQRVCNTAELLVTLINSSEIEKKCTVSLVSMMILLVGDSNNNVLLYEKYAHAYMLETPEIRRSFKITDNKVEFIKACFISENWVGIDCCSKLDILTNVTDNVENSTKTSKQTYLDSYVGVNKKKTPRASKNITDTKVDLKETNKKSAKLLTPVEEAIGTEYEISKKKDTDKSKKEIKICGKKSNNPTESQISENHISDVGFSSEIQKCPLSKINKAVNGPKIKFLMSKSIFGSFDKNKYAIKNVAPKSNKQLVEDNCLLTPRQDEVTNGTLNRNEIEQDKVVDFSESNFGNNSTILKETSANPGAAHKTNVNIVSRSTCNADEASVTKLKESNDRLDLNEIKPVAETNNREQCLDGDKMNSTFIRKMSKKYQFETNQQNKCDIVESENLKEDMDNPDSTVDHPDLRRDFLSPHSKRQRRTNNDGPVFGFFPQKTIKWRSPLVHSPTVKKYSPIRQASDFGGGERIADYFKGNIESLGFQDSFSSKNSSTSNIFDRQVNHGGSGNLPKKKAKHQFPLSDQEYVEEANESFATKLRGLEDICDPEYFGLSNRGKETAVKYYSQLMHTSGKADESSTNAPRINSSKTNVAPKSSDHKSEITQQSQDLFSQSDFLALSKELDISQACAHMKSKTPELPKMDDAIASTSFVPSYPPEHLNNPSNVIFNHNNGRNNNFSLTLPSNTEDCFDARSIRPMSHSQRTERYAPKHRYFNPYLQNEPSYSAGSNHYYDYQRPISDNFHQLPLSTSYPCLCCGHQTFRYLNETHRYDPRSESMMTPHPYYNNYMNARSPYSMCAENHARINDIPENYIDNCLKQLDEEPLSFRVNTNTSSPSNPFQTCGIRGHLGNLKSETIMNRSRDPNFESDQLVYRNRKQNISPQFFAPPNFKFRQTISVDPTVEDKRETLQNVHPGRQVQPESNRRIIRKNFTPTPKPQLIHNSPIYNRVSIVPQITNVSIPASSQRKQLNFNSFEERLDNMIMPQNQNFSSGFANQGMDRCINRHPYHSANRQFFMDRFMQPNNHSDI